jgi:hypothetical protein
MLMPQMRIIRLIKSLQWYFGQQFWKSETNSECCDKTKYCAMKLSQIRRRIDVCMKEIILRFEMNF